MTDSHKVTYDRFSEARWYRDINRHLIAVAKIKPGDSILDIGCGIGSSTAAILESTGSEGRVIALDRNRDYLDMARQKLAPYPNVRFIEAGAAGVSMLINEKVDACFIFNTIHLIPERHALFREISSLLKPDGILAFNTTYFEENDSEFRRFQSNLLLAIVRQFLKRNMSFGERERMYIDSCERYANLLADAGFELLHADIKDAALETANLVDFYSDRAVSGFIASDLNPEEVRDLIVAPLQEQLAELTRQGKTALANKWLHGVARKAP